MKIYENAIDPMLFDAVKSNIYHIDFPWYFSGTAYKYDEATMNYLDFSFSHMVYDSNKNYNSSVCDLLSITIHHALTKSGQKLKRIMRIRLGMIMANYINHVNQPHTDTDIPHMTGLIYLTTSNGPTVIYNEKYDINSNVLSREYGETTLNNNFTIMGKSECIENNMVCFDGLHYHSSTLPTDVPRRIAINFNYQLE